MDSSGPPSPVPHRELSLEIKGIKTDIVISSYEDHILVVATQIGSMGTILNARKEEGMAIHPTFNVSVIFGKRDEPMLVACARQLIENISKFGSSKSLVLSLGLRDHSVVRAAHDSITICGSRISSLGSRLPGNGVKETLKGIVNTVTENRLW